MLDKAHYIVVEGPIGAGKTSLARRLAERLDADTVFEQPERNEFLGRFYQNLDRWALATQISFLFQRIDQLALLEAEGGSTDRRIVSDFILDKDPLFASLNLPTDELRLYRRIFESMKPVCTRKPDLVIYLQAKPETLIGRVHQRGMEAERRITESYLERVAERYAVFSTNTMRRRCSSSTPKCSIPSISTTTSTCCSNACGTCAVTGSSSATRPERGSPLDR
jgi:deoxyguanosine kinase